jgi:WD40 repeat protein
MHTLLRILMLFLLWFLPGIAPAQDKAETFVQLGHSAEIKSLAFSRDGKYMVSGSGDHTIKLWEVSSGKEIRTLKGHGSGVFALAFLQDGKSLASAGDDETIRTWDIATGKETFKFPTDFFKGSGSKIVRFSENGAYALVAKSNSTFAYPPGDGSTKIKVVETATGREVRDLSGIRGTEQRTVSPRNSPSRSFNRAIFSPDGEQVLAVFDYSLKLLDIKSGKVIRTFQAEKYPLSPDMKSAAFSPDGKLILSSTLIDGLVLFDAATGRMLAMFGEGSSTEEVLFSPDGKYAVSAYTDPNGVIQFWDIAGRKMVKTFTHGSYISAGSYGYISFAFAPSGAYLASGGRDKTVKLWDIRSGTEVRKFSGAVNHAYSVDVSPDGRYALSASGREVILWDMAAGRRERVFRGHADTVNAVVFSPDGRFALSASGSFEGITDNTLRLWEIVTGREIRKFTGHGGGIVAAAFSPDGRFVLSGTSTSGHDKTARLWDVATGTEIRRFDHSILVNEAGKKRDAGGGSFHLGFSKDGKTAVVSRQDLTDIYNVKTHYDVYDASTWRRQRTITVGGYSGSAFSPDGNYLLVGRALIEIATGNKRREYADLFGFAHSVAFFPDMNYFAQSVQARLKEGWENRVEIRETASGRLVKTLDGHSGDILSVKFTVDGKKVLSSAADGTVRIWDASSGKEIAQMINFNDGEWIAMTPQGYYTGSEKGDQHVNVRIGNQVYGVDQYREKFYRPEVVMAALAGKPITDLASLTSIKPAPSVAIVETPSSVGSDEATVKVKVADQGGGIGDVRLYLNGSAVVLDRTRNLAVAAVQGKAQVFSYKVRLVSGKNSVRAIAFNAGNSMQSTDALHEIEASIAAKKPSLHALVIGIQEYENPKLTLKYPVADAKLMAATLRERAPGLFEGVNVVELTTKPQTTKEAITKTLKEMSGKVRPDDLFVFFVASHGTVDEGEYFLITSNVGSVSTAGLKQNALSQDDLKALIANVPATKKLVVIDTCNAGKLGEAIQVAMLTRGMNEETAIKILSRAVGSTILSASSSVQEALEGYEGHGLFTYVVAEGLKGKADLNKDGVVNTLELATFVDDQVPALAEKVFKHKQYPLVSPSGQGFPVVRVK